MSYRLPLYTLVLLLLSWQPSTADHSNMKELSPQDLLLLNVAVKGRLVERLTDSITHMETLREKMVKYVKTCLFNVSSTVELCQDCVRDRCTKRARECNVEITSINEVEAETNIKSIPGVEFLRNPDNLKQGLEDMTEHAHTDIISEVPPELQSKGDDLLHAADDKLTVLQEKLKNSVKELPGIIPRVTNAIKQNVSPDFDPEALVNLADQTVGTITKVFSDKDNMGTSINTMVEQLPDLIAMMNQKMATMSAALGTFVSRAHNNLMNSHGGELAPLTNNAWGASGESMNQAPHFIGKAIDAVHQNVPRMFNEMWQGMRQVPQTWTRLSSPRPGGENELDHQQWTVKRLDVAGNGHVGSGFMITHSSSGRFRRSEIVDCYNLAADSAVACHAYHFHCAPCLNETVILKHDCGPTAIKMMVAIKKIDLKAADYLMTYTKHVKKGSLVKRVEYDPESFDTTTKTYQHAFITAKLRNEIVRYHTALLPNLDNLQTSGAEVGDEIWRILDSDDEEFKDRTTSRGQTTHSQDPLQHQSSSASAVIHGVVWGTVCFIMHLGYIVL